MRATPYVLTLLVIACSTPDADPVSRERSEPPIQSSKSSEPSPVASPAVPLSPPTSPAPFPPAGELPPPITAGPGSSMGPEPEFAKPEASRASLEHDGATVLALAHLLPKDESVSTTQLQVRVEFAGLPPKFGLNYVGGGGDESCDEVIPEVQEIAVLDDGRWLVDAQLACRSGEDYFSAKNDHTLLLVHAQGRGAEVLWTGVDTGSNAMGVCSSSSVTSFVVEGDVLRVSTTEITTLDREAAKQLPAAAEGCVPKPETTREVARIELPKSP